MSRISPQYKLTVLLLLLVALICVSSPSSDATPFVPPMCSRRA